MAKKTVWKDDTIPPTNYIWVKTDTVGGVQGVYEHDGRKWVKIATGEGGGGCMTGDGIINVTDLHGHPMKINFSKAPDANTIVLRTDTGAVRVMSPKNPDEAVDLATLNAMFSWIEK